MLQEANQNYLANYLLQLGDTSLILSQRLGELCGHGPVLEQDIAMTNIALDLLGEARSYLQYAGELCGQTEDELAFQRPERAFRNVQLAELPNGDFAHTVARQFYFDVYHVGLLQLLESSTDGRLAAIAEKSLKEALYHQKWSSEWVIRLGDGTAESHDRMTKAINAVWPYTGELFRLSAAEQSLIAEGVIPNPGGIFSSWQKTIHEVCYTATIDIPNKPNDQYHGGKEGIHTEGMGYLLGEMQYVQRCYPGLEW
ncbi:MAG: phenylacetate-CoA oxygenase subunit PaaC [Edaphocola sp.]